MIVMSLCEPIVPAPVHVRRLVEQIQQIAIRLPKLLELIDDFNADRTSPTIRELLEQAIEGAERKAARDDALSDCRH